MCESVRPADTGAKPGDPMRQRAGIVRIPDAPSIPGYEALRHRAAERLNANDGVQFFPIERFGRPRTAAQARRSEFGVA